jgi:hypothetical protein
MRVPAQEPTAYISDLHTRGALRRGGVDQAGDQPIGDHDVVPSPEQAQEPGQAAR